MGHYFLDIQYYCSGYSSLRDGDASQDQRLPSGVLCVPAVRAQVPFPLPLSLSLYLFIYLYRLLTFTVSVPFSLFLSHSLCLLLYLPPSTNVHNLCLSFTHSLAFSVSVSLSVSVSHHLFHCLPCSTNVYHLECFACQQCGHRCLILSISLSTFISLPIYIVY